MYSDGSFKMNGMFEVRLDGGIDSINGTLTAQISKAQRITEFKAI